MQTSGKKTCFQFPECSLSYAKLARIGETITLFTDVVPNIFRRAVRLGFVKCPFTVAKPPVYAP